MSLVILIDVFIKSFIFCIRVGAISTNNEIKSFNTTLCQYFIEIGYCKYIFKNGSFIDNLAASEKSRGKRRHGGLVEECVGVDGTILNEVVIPVMNISRRLPDGTKDDDEVLNKSQIFVTTAGWKNTFAKLIKVIGELKPREPQNEGVALCC